MESPGLMNGCRPVRRERRRHQQKLASFNSKFRSHGKKMSARNGFRCGVGPTALKSYPQSHRVRFPAGLHTEGHEVHEDPDGPEVRLAAVWLPLNHLRAQVRVRHPEPLPPQVLTGRSLPRVPPTTKPEKMLIPSTTISYLNDPQRGGKQRNLIIFFTNRSFSRVIIKTSRFQFPKK